MRTTVDIPDGIYRQLKSRAARDGSSTRALILRGIKEVPKTDRRRAGTPVSLPIVFPDISDKSIRGVMHGDRGSTAATLG